MLLLNSTNSTIGEEDYSVGVSPTHFTTPCNPSFYSALFRGSPVRVISYPRNTRERYTFHQIRVQGTQGAVPEETLHIFGIKDIFKPANNILQSYEEKEIKLAAKNILEIISRELEKQRNISQLAPIYAFPADDGSLLIEWIFDDFRVGFNLEEDMTNSSWYLVSKPSTGSIHASGYLHGVDIQSVVGWLVAYVASQFS